jgi:hypothetical protein
MRRLLIGCIAVASWIYPARAAQYEVIPTTYDHNVTSSSYNYQATIFDNVSGKVFVCTTTYTELSEKALTYTCYDHSKEMISTLTPSSDLNTTIQSSNWQGSLPVAGFWQINSRSGGLQFCLATQRPSYPYRPENNNCIRLDWKDAKPF